MTLGKTLMPVLLIAAILLPVSQPTRTAIAQDDYWPTNGWRTSTPEEQGLDSAQLMDVLKIMEEGEKTSTINSVLVIRHGYIVLDASVAPFRTDAPHQLYSVTKSFMATLVGIAIDKGYIEGVDQSIWDFFDASSTAAMDERKQSIVLENLLTMTSGLNVQNISNDMYALGPDDPSWIQFVLDQEMVAEPGTQFDYSDSVAQLTSAIISQATGRSAADFAQEHLFAPLGITNTTWSADPQGVSIGGDAFNATPYDMAKLGYLYLHGGEWDGQQIVSSDWVTTATTLYECSDCPSYGYYWWLPDPANLAPGIPNYYWAGGYAGQNIIVFPDKDLIIVFTGGAFTDDDNSQIIESIIPALQSDEPLPANPEAVAALTATIERLAHPTPEPVPAAPAIAESVSGVTYTLRDNPMGWTTLALEFGETEALLHLDGQDGPLELAVGLDGVYRLNTVMRPPTVRPLRFDYWALPRIPESTFAAKGFWVGDSGFTIVMRDTVGVESWLLGFNFKENGLEIIVSELLQTYSGRVRGIPPE
ncbi:MAG: beta-lactamase family protein [Anaerolineae bacterium]|nr:beta-lactamase family protein [Anaerolineae bacterium]